MNGTWTRAWVGPALVVGLFALSGCDDGGADTDTDGPVDSGAAGAGGAATGGTGGGATGGTGGSAGSGAGGSWAGGSGGAGGRLACPHTPAPRGGRLLGIDLLNVNESADFDANLRHAETLGAQFLALHLLWTQLEPAPGTFEDPGGALGAFAGVVEQEDLRFSLTIRPIDLTGKTVPEDLEDVRFNDGEMVARFLAALDFALGIFPADRLTSIQIGNEIDGFDASGEHPDFWSDYGAFLAGVVAHVRTTYPGLRVGFTGTLHGLTEGPLRDVGVWTAYAGVVDVVGVTHYPLDGAFQVRAPADVFDDLDRLAAEFPDTPLLLQEVGYQTAAASGSSEAKQAAFFCDFFAAWDQHAEHIEAANIVRLNDVSEAAAAELA